MSQNAQQRSTEWEEVGEAGWGWGKKASQEGGGQPIRRGGLSTSGLVAAAEGGKGRWGGPECP